jgi:hypothetical protein
MAAKIITFRKPTRLHADPVAIATANDRSGVHGDAHRAITLLEEILDGKRGDALRALAVDVGVRQSVGQGKVGRSLLA